MTIAILGTGSVGQTLAEKLIEIGHTVVMGTRDVAATVAREKFADWHSKHQAVALSTMNDAVQKADIIINALKGEATLAAFASLSAEHLTHKIVIDIANPLDSSKGFPPSLTAELCNTNSLGEALQNAIPAARVVKTLSTMWCGIMVNPNMINQGQHINYICGNDAEAKATVKALLLEMGWTEASILDLGDITNARGTEAYLLLWIRIYAATSNGAFNMNIVK
jgi:8-hydroxy-5-deazaflavin:NADPH oxidoreductase